MDEPLDTFYLENMSRKIKLKSRQIFISIGIIDVYLMLCYFACFIYLMEYLKFLFIFYFILKKNYSTWKHLF